MKQILVVDDEELVRAIIREHLLMRDYQVLEASDGLEALDLLAANQVDLVITDINMPRADGVYLLTKAHERYPKLPIIIMTGRPSVQAAVQCFKTGAVDFLTKPLEFAKLQELLNTTLASLNQGVDLTQTPVTQKIRRIAGYTVERTIGTGTYGMVFLASRTVQGVTESVALKILRGSEYGSGPNNEALARFEREATAAASITHPNVVRILDHGWANEEEIPYLVMEFVEGRSLKDLITGGETQTWDYETRARLLRQLASAIQAIHQANLCHRDIKSQNIMVTRERQCKITDFGIVKVPESQLTNPGNLVGTPSYMAPEAFLSSNTDARADLFSLGAVAYELFCNRLPFDGDTVAQLAMSVTRQRPPEPRSIDPDFPKPLQFILARLLKKSPDERYQTAAEVVSDLDEFLSGDWEPRMGLLSIFRTVNLARDWA